MIGLVLLNGRIIYFKMKTENKSLCFVCLNAKKQCYNDASRELTRYKYNGYYWVNTCTLYEKDWVKIIKHGKWIKK